MKIGDIQAGYPMAGGVMVAVSKDKMRKLAKIFDAHDGHYHGQVELSEEEALHFSNAPRCAAKVALSIHQLDELALDEDDQIEVEVQD